MGTRSQRRSHPLARPALRDLSEPGKMLFSGATLVEEDRVIAMYHGTVVGNMVAVSSDPLLLNWEKVSSKAVIPAKHADGTTPVYRVFESVYLEKR